MKKNILTALCAMIMTFSIVTIALADEANDGYNTSNTDNVTIGTDPNTGGEAPGDAQNMQSIQDQTESMKERWSGDAQRQAVENGN
jgi:peptidoglycan hydrolase CwlO-like protein